jgi:hypothetical protein
VFQPSKFRQSVTESLFRLHKFTPMPALNYNQLLVHSFLLVDSLGYVGGCGVLAFALVPSGFVVVFHPDGLASAFGLPPRKGYTPA